MAIKIRKAIVVLLVQILFLGMVSLAENIPVENIQGINIKQLGDSSGLEKNAIRPILMCGTGRNHQ